MLNLEPEEEYIVCYYDGEYDFTTMYGKDVEEWFLRGSGYEIRFVFKKADAVYEV